MNNFFVGPSTFYLGAPIGGVGYLELPFGITVPVPVPARLRGLWPEP